MSKVVTLLTTTSGSATGGSFTPDKNSAANTTRTGPLKFMATEAGTGAVTATILIEVTTNAAVTTSWITLGTITLSGTTTAQDGFASSADWPCVRARTTAISGTGATVTVTMAV